MSQPAPRPQPQAKPVLPRPQVERERLDTPGGRTLPVVIGGSRYYGD